MDYASSAYNDLEIVSYDPFCPGCLDEQSECPESKKASCDCSAIIDAFGIEGNPHPHHRGSCYLQSVLTYAMFYLSGRALADQRSVLEAMADGPRLRYEATLTPTELTTPQQLNPDPGLAATFYCQPYAPGAGNPGGPTRVVACAFRAHDEHRELHAKPRSDEPPTPQHHQAKI